MNSYLVFVYKNSTTYDKKGNSIVILSVTNHTHITNELESFNTRKIAFICFQNE